MGDAEGVADVAREHGLRHLAEIERTELGTPLMSSAFRVAAAAATARSLCYVNADILLYQRFFDAASAIGFGRFLASSRRVNIDPAIVDEAPSEERVLEWARAGTFDSEWAMDVFLFPAALRLDLPPFAVGRPGWDNWLVSHARDLRIPVVDLTPTAAVVHQTHGYGHVPGGTGNSYEGPEAVNNRVLAGGPDTLCTLDCATHVMLNGKVRRARSLARLRAEVVVRLPVRLPFMRPVIHFVRRLASSAKGESRSGMKGDALGQSDEDGSL